MSGLLGSYEGNGFLLSVAVSTFMSQTPPAMYVTYVGKSWLWLYQLGSLNLLL